ncbi:MAG TPA: HlyD family secretion protein [Gammaproteobacteria bacterium]
MSNVETNAAPTSMASVPPSRKRRRRVLLIGVPFAVLCVSALVYLLGGRYVETENAYVKADKIPVSVEVSGTVRDVLVRENQSVGAGEVLFRLDPEPFEVAVAKAEAKLAQARTEIAALKASYREKQAQITLARTRASYAKSEQQRQTELVANQFVTASHLDEAQQNADLATQQIITQQQDLRRIAESLGGSADLPVEQHPSYLLAQAELQQARLNLAHAEVRAALPGIVSKPPKPGQYIATGTTALALVVNNSLWIEANFPETELTYVQPGQPVTIHVDTYPDFRWQGRVESVSPATGAEFSLIPAQNATGNWVKIAQRVPVRIKLEHATDAPQLLAGLSTTVEIDTGHRRRLLGLSL